MRTKNLAYVDISFATATEKKVAAAVIEQRLLQTLAVVNTQTTNDHFVLTAKDENGALQGGLTAATSYGWLLVKALWVEETFRRSRLGSRLLELAEHEGRRLDCHSAWLDTSTAAARDFYQKRGYREFGRLANRPHQSPPGHCRWFLQKEL